MTFLNCFDTSEIYSVRLWFWSKTFNFSVFKDCADPEKFARVIAWLVEKRGLLPEDFPCDTLTTKIKNAHPDAFVGVGLLQEKNILTRESFFCIMDNTNPANLVASITKAHEIVCLYKTDKSSRFFSHAGLFTDSGDIIKTLDASSKTGDQALLANIANKSPGDRLKKILLEAKLLTADGKVNLTQLNHF